jgi:hypothetical protein
LKAKGVASLSPVATAIKSSCLWFLRFAFPARSGRGGSLITPAGEVGEPRLAGLGGRGDLAGTQDVVVRGSKYGVPPVHPISI